MREDRPDPAADLTFAHHWQATILRTRPLILPTRSFVYPGQAEEVERGALEILIRAGDDTHPFLATCALGFRDPSVPNGIWSTPNPAELCAVCGGYAYIIDTATPTRFTMIPFRPVLKVIPVAAEGSVAAEGLLLFAGHHAMLAWGASGQAWQSEKLSDEGIAVTSIGAGQLHGMGWNMMTDRETAFALDLKTGLRIGTRRS